MTKIAIVCSGEGITREQLIKKIAEAGMSDYITVEDGNTIILNEPSPWEKLEEEMLNELKLIEILNTDEEKRTKRNEPWRKQVKQSHPAYRKK